MPDVDDQGYQGDYNMDEQGNRQAPVYKVKGTVKFIDKVKGEAVIEPTDAGALTFRVPLTGNDYKVGKSVELEVCDEEVKSVTLLD